jgi:hypothetical protein
MNGLCGPLSSPSGEINMPSVGPSLFGAIATHMPSVYVCMFEYVFWRMERKRPRYPTNHRVFKERFLTYIYIYIIIKVRFSCP